MEAKESSFNPFVWAYKLNQDRINYGIDPFERLQMIYAKYHSFDEFFIDAIYKELNKLISTNR